MAAVINRNTFEYLPSANTPDYPDPPWKVNPDLSQVVGIAVKYWKWDGVADRPVPMTAGEQAAVDAAELITAKAAEKLRYAERVLTAMVTTIVDRLNVISAGSVRQSQRIALGGDAILTNVGANYDAIAVSRGLGILQVNFAGVDTLDWGVAVNKIGNGTQSWQLWNETDGVQLGVINDSGVAGEKILTGTQIASGLPSGEKLVRIRAKSTTAADDPVYHGGWLVLGSTLPQITYAQAKTAIEARIDEL